MKRVSSLLTCVLLYFVFSYDNCVFGADTTIILIKLKNESLTNYLLSTQKEKESLLSPYDRNIISILHEFDVLHSVQLHSKLSSMRQRIQVAILNTKKISFIEKLRSNNSVSIIEQLPDYQLFSILYDLSPNQWSLPKISGETAWDITKGKSSIRVAIVDDATFHILI